MKTTIAELIEINDRNIKKLEKLSEKETDRFFQGMLTYAQSFDLDLHRFKKLEKGIIETIYQETCKGNPEPLNLTQGCENQWCENGKIEIPYNYFISCSICENKEYNYVNRIDAVNILNNKMKQTAVEWLYETLWKQTDFSLPNNILEQAKEMEKQQIIEARVKIILDSNYVEAEQYYNETFKNK